MGFCSGGSHRSRGENRCCPAFHYMISWPVEVIVLVDQTIFPGGMKSEMAVANATTFEIMFRATGRGAYGYAKPNNAQTAKIKNMPARRNRVYLDSFMMGDNVSSAKLKISTRKSGKKKSRVNNTVGVGGNVRHMTMRSKGSSKIIGAAIVPTMALPTATQNPLCLARYTITKKATKPESSVTGVIGSA